MRGLFTGFALLLSVFCAEAGDTVKVLTPRGESIEIIEEKPAGHGPFPTLILAPGTSYHMRLPILEKLAGVLPDQGIAVIRFNWAYYVKDPQHGKPSQNRISEIEDMTAVLDYARKKAWVDPQNLMIGGKSLGSIIAWRLFQANPDVKSALLLTPVCSSQSSGKIVSVQANYPDSGTERRQSLWVMGDTDPVCKTTALYRYLSEAGTAARIVVVSGNHSFESNSKDDKPSKTVETIDLVTKITADFARTSFQPE